jgi:hypothetical protein
MVKGGVGKEGPVNRHAPSPALMHFLTEVPLLISLLNVVVEPPTFSVLSAQHVEKKRRGPLGATDMHT